MASYDYELGSQGKLPCTITDDRWNFSSMIIFCWCWTMGVVDGGVSILSLVSVSSGEQ